MFFPLKNFNKLIEIFFSNQIFFFFDSMAFEEFVIFLQAIVSFAAIIIAAFCFFYTISLKMEKYYKQYLIFLKLFNFIVTILIIPTFMIYNKILCFMLLFMSIIWFFILWTGFPKQSLSTPLYLIALLGTITEHFAWMFYLINEGPTFLEGITIFLLFIWGNPIFIVAGFMKSSKRKDGLYVGFWKDTIDEMSTSFRIQLNKALGADREP